MKIIGCIIFPILTPSVELKLQLGLDICCLCTAGLLLLLGLWCHLDMYDLPLYMQILKGKRIQQ